MWPTVQEYFVDDLCELMLYVGQTNPKALEGLQLEEIMIFMVVFMGSPGYVKNPFLRSRISEVTPLLPLPLLLSHPSSPILPSLPSTTSLSL